MNKSNLIRFFMSADTQRGFVTYLSEIKDIENIKNIYLIKGGEAEEKSTLIKEILKKEGNTKAEIIYNPFDINLLEAVIFRDKDIAFVNADYPNTIEPRIAGITEKVISLYDCYDSNVLKTHREEIEELYEEKTINERKKDSFIRAAGMLISSNESIVAGAIEKDKITNFISRLCLREFKRASFKKGVIHNRFLSTLTEKGIFVFTDTAKALCNKIYVIKDEYGAVSDVILSNILMIAYSLGYEIYCSRCPLSQRGKPEHIFIPELSLGFMTSNKFHPINIEGSKTVRSERFINSEKIREYSYRMTFQKKAAKELLREAIILIGKIKETDEKLKEIYSLALKKEKVRDVFDTLIS